MMIAPGGAGLKQNNILSSNVKIGGINKWSSSSLSFRYFSKLSTNFIKLVANLVIALLVPRSLGPSHFGDFNFIFDTFQKIVMTLDLNVSSAHFNYSSKCTESKDISAVYLIFCLIVAVALFVGVGVLSLTGASKYLWPGESITYICLGAILAYFVYVADAINGLSDSKEITTSIELRRLIVIIAGICGLVLLYAFNFLNLASFFIYQILLFLSLIVVSALYVKKIGVFDFKLRIIGRSEFKKSISYFYSYSHPLVTITFFGLICAYFDRWFLQIIGGSEMQGFYSLAFRLSTVCILFVGAMAPLFQQHIAKSYGNNNDVEQVRIIFGKAKAFYFMVAALSMFFAFNSAKIINMIGGSMYSSALLPLMIMMFFPIHQSFGQLCGGVLLGLERTDIYRNISIFSGFLGLGLTYFLLAPRTYIIPGMQLGAVGLAVKMVALQFLSVNIMLLYACKIIRYPIFKMMIYQFVAPLPPLLVFYFVNYFGSIVKFSSSSTLIVVFEMSVQFLVYCFMLVCIVLLFPSFIGIGHADLISYKNRMWTFYISKRKKIMPSCSE